MYIYWWYGVDNNRHTLQYGLGQLVLQKNMAKKDGYSMGY